MKAVLILTATLATLASAELPAAPPSTQPAERTQPATPPQSAKPLAQAPAAVPGKEWRDILARELPRMGHRNFIVIADSAYPLQSAPGIQTVATGASHIEVLRAVLSGIGKAGHVKPVIHLDKELRHVTETAAPGIGSFREQLAAALGDTQSVELPHMDIIRKLDESSQLFHVLILKTTLALPYTSVFIELDCGYWSDDKENALREAIQDSEPQ